MQSHTGCICLTFLHCVFSNVSSNRLPEQMQNHTGCICWTFLHCAFSNVSSNDLLEKRQSHTGCICLTFLHYVFSMSPQMVCLKGCIITLAACKATRTWPLSASIVIDLLPPLLNLFQTFLLFKVKKSRSNSIQNMAVLIGRYQTTELNVNRQLRRKHKKVRKKWLELGIR